MIPEHLQFIPLVVKFSILCLFDALFTVVDILHELGEVQDFIDALFIVENILHEHGEVQDFIVVGTWFVQRFLQL